MNKIFSFSFFMILTLLLSACTQKKPNDLSSAQDNSFSSLTQQEAKTFFESSTSDTLSKDTQASKLSQAQELQENTLPEQEFDIPMVMNVKVEKWLDYFQNRGRRSFAAWLARSGKYMPMMKKILTENGLPLDLVYLSMIESGYSPTAYSHAHASGLWQFIRGTGTRYGLKSNWWIDERRDAEKSSIAAAQYLKDLYGMFDHWYLAAAGYNAGEYKILRAIKRYDTNDFWEMSRFGYLKPETKNYVPKIIAAAMIAKNPQKYGFTDIQYDEPLKYSKVLIRKPTELSVVAKYLNLPSKTLRDLNPELLRGVTPPQYPNYELKIPYGMELAFEEAYPKISQYSVDLVTKHRVQRGEAISIIARKYGVPYRSIMDINNMTSTRIRAGQVLIIPQKKGTVYQGSKTSSTTASTASTSMIKYKVRRGDSLWSISRKFNVSVSQLRQWNQIKHSNTVHIGDIVHVQSPSNAAASKKTFAKSSGNDQWIYYKVEPGDSLWSIARKYGTSISNVLEWNDLNQSNVTLYPGNTLKIKPIKS